MDQDCWQGYMYVRGVPLNTKGQGAGPRDQGDDADDRPAFSTSSDDACQKCKRHNINRQNAPKRTTLVACSLTAAASDPVSTTHRRQHRTLNTRPQHRLGIQCFQYLQCQPDRQLGQRDRGLSLQHSRLFLVGSPWLESPSPSHEPAPTPLHQPLPKHSAASRPGPEAQISRHRMRRRHFRGIGRSPAHDTLSHRGRPYAGGYRRRETPSAHRSAAHGTRSPDLPQHPHRGAALAQDAVRGLRHCLSF